MWRIAHKAEEWFKGLLGVCYRSRRPTGLQDRTEHVQEQITFTRLYELRKYTQRLSEDHRVIYRCQYMFSARESPLILLFQVNIELTQCNDLRHSDGL